MKFSFSIRSEFEIPSIARTGLRTPDGHVCVSLSSAHDQCDQIGATFVGRFLGSKLSYKNAQMLSKVLDYFVKCHFFSKNCCSCILGNFFLGGECSTFFSTSGHTEPLRPLCYWGGLVHNEWELGSISQEPPIMMIMMTIMTAMEMAGGETWKKYFNTVETLKELLLLALSIHLQFNDSKGENSIHWLKLVLV